MPDCCGTADLRLDRCAPASLALRVISCHLGELVVLPADEEGGDCQELPLGGCCCRDGSGLIGTGLSGRNDRILQAPS